MDGSIVFARWRQCVLPWGHIWRHLANTIELVLPQPTRLHKQDSKLIGWAIFPQLTEECCRLSGTMASPGECDWYLNLCILWPMESTAQTGNRSLQPFMHSPWQKVPCTLQLAPISPKTAPSHGGSVPPSNTIPWSHPSPQRFSHFCTDDRRHVRILYNGSPRSRQTHQTSLKISHDRTSERHVYNAFIEGTDGHY